jgi:hypothetical protein
MVKVTAGCEFTVYVPAASAGMVHFVGAAGARAPAPPGPHEAEPPVVESEIDPPSTLTSQVPNELLVPSSTKDELGAIAPASAR